MRIEKEIERIIGANIIKGRAARMVIERGCKNISCAACPRTDCEGHKLAKRLQRRTKRGREQQTLL